MSNTNRKEGKSEFTEVIIANFKLEGVGILAAQLFEKWGEEMISIISWVGGKRILRKKILPLIPKHDIYCEVFGGTAWILFGKSPNKEDWQLSKKSRYTEVSLDFLASSSLILMDTSMAVMLWLAAWSASRNMILAGTE